jgi:enamine deaminase RidA (YjgF/YER057c/UK114 family)
MTIERSGVGPRMSEIVLHNGTVYLCGQVATDNSTGIKEQTRSMLENVASLLARAGSGRDRILSATIYLLDMKDYAAMNEVWDAWLPAGHAPARACVEARLADPDLLVEVSIVAAAARIACEVHDPCGSR